VFFFACMGSSDSIPRWREALSQHADWLGLTAYPFSRLISDGRVFAFGWVSLRPPDIDALVREDGDRLTIISLDTLTRAEALEQERPRGFETNAIRMDVSLLSGEVRVAVPIITPEQFYWASSGGDWVFGDDLRLMVRWTGLELDDVAVFAFLQYGFVPPPLTISRTVRRISPGHRLLLRPTPATASVERFFEPAELWYKDRDTSDADELLREALDGVLSKAPQPAVMHFSGGVDSGLMAARLAAMGRRDVRLQNFSEGPEDSFREVAPAMAAHLGLPFDRVEWEQSEIPDVLNDLAREYSFPFDDAATIPTMMLLRAMSRWIESPLSFLEGTAAASLLEWGLHYSKWRQIHLIPRPLRLAAAKMYQLGLWRHDSQWVRPLAALQTSTQMPLLNTMRSTLNGVAYRIPPEIRTSMEHALAEGLTATTLDMDPRDGFSLLSLTRFGAHFSAIRGFEPMRRRGILSVFPYMEPAVVRAGFSLTWDQKYEGRVVKIPLKRLLARSVPREWVYWPKGVFNFPFRKTFTHADTRAFIEDVVLTPKNPLMGYLVVDNVKTVFRRAETGKPLHVGARKFLWGLTFASAWLNGLEAS